MVSIKVASWNVEDQFPTPEVQKAIATLDADLVVLPEAMPQAQLATFHLGMYSPLSDYQVHAVPYDDVDHRQDSHALVVLTKHWLRAKVRTVNLGRTAQIVEVFDGCIACVHLDDRSEKTRLIQARTLLDALGRGQAAVIGDLNSARSPVLHGVLSPIAQEWRMFGLPIGTPGEVQSKLARAGSLMTRLSEMTSGGAVKRFYKNGFIDADPERLRTKLFAGKIPMTQLDHILVRSIEATNFDRPRIVTSDHLPIVAKLSF